MKKIQEELNKAEACVIEISDFMKINLPYRKLYTLQKRPLHSERPSSEVSGIYKIFM